MRYDVVDFHAFDEKLKKHGVYGDARRLNDGYIMRFAPTALYNTEEECDQLAQTI